MQKQNNVQSKEKQKKIQRYKVGADESAELVRDPISTVDNIYSRLENMDADDPSASSLSKESPEEVTLPPDHWDDECKCDD